MRLGLHRHTYACVSGRSSSLIIDNLKSRSGGSRETDEVAVKEVDIEEEALNDDEMELQTLLNEFVTNKKRGFKKSNDTSTKTLPKHCMSPG